MTELAQRIAAWLLAHPGAKASDLAKAFNITEAEVITIMRDIAQETINKAQDEKGK